MSTRGSRLLTSHTATQGWTVYAFTASRPDAPFDGTITVDQRGLVRQFVFNPHKLGMGYTGLGDGPAG